MKKTLYLSLIFVTIFFACHKEPKDAVAEVFLPGDMATGFATFEKNGLMAKGTIKCYKNWKDSFNMSLKTYIVDQPIPREYYDFGLIPLYLGKYKLRQFDVIDRHPSSTLYTTFNTYTLDENQDNYVEIIAFDSLKVKGKFQLFFQIDKSKEGTNEPDYLSIQKGEFEGNLK